MIKSFIGVDLPSVETERRKTLLEQLKELFGAKIELKSGYEETTVTAFSLLDGVCGAATRAQLNDAISLIVDKKVIYLDTNNVGSDLTMLWQSANDKGVFQSGFQEMHVALAHHEAGLYVIIDVRVQRTVVVGAAEMSVELTARPEALVVQPGESAQGYANRVTEYARDQQTLTHQRSVLNGITQRLAAELSRSLPGSRFNVREAGVQLIRPEGRQLRRFRQLSWGNQVQTPHYRPVPTQSRYGAYSDPFYYYWYDPYWDFAHFMMLSSILHHGGWHDPHVMVVSPAGQPLYTADQADHHQNDPYMGPGVVSVGSESIGVSEAVPDTGWGGSDVLTADSPHGGSEGWGGSDVHDHGWGGSDTSSSDSSSSDSGSSGDSGSSCSSSSCGSSCSSSSCGSSCGGGGGD